MKPTKPNAQKNGLSHQLLKQRIDRLSGKERSAFFAGVFAGVTHIATQTIEYRYEVVQEIAKNLGYHLADVDDLDWKETKH